MHNYHEQSFVKQICYLTVSDNISRRFRYFDAEYTTTDNVKSRLRLAST
jgi:hypothetical protein